MKYFKIFCFCKTDYETSEVKPGREKNGGFLFIVISSRPEFHF